MLSVQASHVHWVGLEKEVCNHTEVALFCLHSSSCIIKFRSVFLRNVGELQFQKVRTEFYNHLIIILVFFIIIKQALCNQNYLH